MMQAPRVCHVVATFFPSIGGVQTATLGLCRHLSESGTDVVVLTRRLPKTSRYDRVEGVSVLRAGLPIAGKLGSFTFIVDGFMVLGSRLSSYRVLHLQNMHAPLLLGLLAHFLLRRQLVATVHTEAAVETRLGSRAGRLRMRIAARAVRSFATLTDAIGEAVRSLGVEESRIHVIPNGVDTHRYRPASAGERERLREAHGIPGGKQVVLFVGRLVDVKNVDLLIEAWGALKPEEAVLLIAGDGPERSRLRMLAAETGAQGIQFLGQRDDIVELLRVTDIYVLPSESEGLPVALIEAAASGVASIASDIGGCRAVLGDEGAVYFPSRDVKRLEEALGSLLVDEERRTTLGDRAVAAARERFSLDSVVRAYQRVYEIAVPAGHERPGC